MKRAYYHRNKGYAALLRSAQHWNIINLQISELQCCFILPFNTMRLAGN